LNPYILIERTKIKMKLHICILLAALAVMTEGTKEGLRGLDQLEESTVVDVTRRLPFEDLANITNNIENIGDLWPFENLCIICSGPGDNDLADTLCGATTFVLCLLNICNNCTRY